MLRPLVAEGQQRADRHEVLAREERGRRDIRGQTHQVERGPLGRLAVAEVAPDQPLVHGDARAAHRGLVAGPALARGRDRAQVAQEGDATMVMGQEVVDRLTSAVAVRDEHGVGVEEVRRPVDEHDGQARLDLASEVAVVHPRRDDDEPVHPPEDHRARDLPLQHGVLVKARREDRHAPLRGDVADRAVHGRGVGVGDVLEHEPDCRRAALRPAQRRGRHVGSVVETRRCLLDARAQIRPDARLPVDDPRYRLDADPGERGDIVKRGSPTGTVAVSRALDKVVSCSSASGGRSK